MGFKDTAWSNSSSDAKLKAIPEPGEDKRDHAVLVALKYMQDPADGKELLLALGLIPAGERVRCGFHSSTRLPKTRAASSAGVSSPASASPAAPQAR